METAVATPTESAPSQQAPSSVSQSEQSFLDSTRQVAKSQETAQPQPTDQQLPTQENGEQLPNEKPNELPPTVEYKIKDIHGNEKTVNPEWMTKFFQAVGQEALLPLINDEKNAPLLLHIAERTLKLNQAYQEASKLRPEYESYKGDVETYFQEIRQAPDEGFERMMNDMGISESDQEAIIEKMALKLIEKREMSPEQRAAQAALREQQRAQAEVERYKQEAEELKNSMEAQQRAPLYQTGIASALTDEGIEINDTTWDVMVKMCKQQFGQQKEPITQEQFKSVAKYMAQLGMSFKKANSTAAQPGATPTRTVSKGFQGKATPQPVNKGAMSEEEWLQSQGMKKY